MAKPEEPISVCVLGATGSVGQRFVQLLDGHPWFRVTALTGSDRSVGMRYGEACRWVLSEPMPDWARAMRVEPSQSTSTMAQIAFSALPSEKAHALEPHFAEAGMMVCSNASAYRQAPDVPVLLPEVNPDHTEALHLQRQRWPAGGGIVTNPNCTSTGMTVALKPLLDAFGLRRVFAVSLQALSGAGYPGVASLDILDNVIPFIDGEEEKVEMEPRKMLGGFNGSAFEPADFVISAQANRVAVSDGHMVCLSVELETPANLEQVTAALRDYTPPLASRDLPSAPRPVITLMTQSNRPQPRLDRMHGRGMTTVVGRLRSDPLFHIKMVVLSHNTIRGAAGGSIYNAELLVQQGWVD
jgi:aspartate-semialdehyde dehydrogenase